jgi:serine kinase of HPr protein (carbohydrate metabolism regulator)
MGKGIITDVGPRYWRTGFIHVTPLEIEGKEGYLPLEVNGRSYPQIITRGNGMKETETSIQIKSEWSLAQAFAESKLIERLQKKVADMELAEMLMNRALPVVITRMMQRFEDTLRENIINQDLGTDSLHQQVKEATSKLTDELQRTTPPSQGEEYDAEG